jgi:hypothetical protein
VSVASLLTVWGIKKAQPSTSTEVFALMNTRMKIVVRRGLGLFAIVNKWEQKNCSPAAGIEASVGWVLHKKLRPM